MPAGKVWSQIVASYKFACGATTSGQALCWGDDNSGRTTVPPSLSAPGSLDLAPAGFYRPGAEDNLPCPAGWTSRPGAITVLGCSIQVDLRCPPGQERNATSQACSLCSPGMYKPLLSAANCTPCVAGTFANVSGSSTCAQCPEGSYEEAIGRFVSWFLFCFAITSLSLSRLLDSLVI